MMSNILKKILKRPLIFLTWPLFKIYKVDKVYNNFLLECMKSGIADLNYDNAHGFCKFGNGIYFYFSNWSKFYGWLVSSKFFEKDPLGGHQNIEIYSFKLQDMNDTGQPKLKTMFKFEDMIEIYRQKNMIKIIKNIIPEYMHHNLANKLSTKAPVKVKNYFSTINEIKEVEFLGKKYDNYQQALIDKKLEELLKKD